MTTSTLPVTDPVRIQAIKDSLAEGRMILRTGMFNGQVQTPEYLCMVRRTVESDFRKLGFSEQAISALINSDLSYDPYID